MEVRDDSKQAERDMGEQGVVDQAVRASDVGEQGQVQPVVSHDDITKD